MTSLARLNLILSIISAVIGIYAFVTGRSDLRSAVGTGTSASSVVNDANFWLTLFQTIAVFYVVALAVAFTLVTFVIDVVLLVFNQHFPVTVFLWDVVWNKIVTDWYWSNANSWGVVWGIIALVIIGFISGDGADE